MGFLAFFIYIAGILGLVSRSTSIVILASFIIIGLISNDFSYFKKTPSFLYTFKAIFKKENKLELIFVSLLLLFIFFNLFRNFTPPTDNDSIAAYLSIPKWFVLKGEIYPINTTVWDNTPQYTQMLSVVGLTFDSIYLPQLLTGWVTGILGALLTYLLEKELKLSRKHALMAALIFYISPTILWINATNKTDLLWTVFDLSAFYIFFKFIYTKEKLTYNSFYFILIGILLGFGFGTKYQTLLTISIILILLFYKIYNYHKTNYSLILKNTIYYSFLIGIMMLLISSPNLLKNLSQHNNPLFPLFDKMEVLSSNTKNTDHLADTNYIGKILSFFIGKNYFITKNIIFNAQAFGGIVLCLIPFSFLSKFNKKYSVTFLLIFFLYASGMILIQPPYPRHVLPSLGFLSIISSVGFFYIYNNFQKIKYPLLVLTIMSLLFHAENRIKSFINNDWNYFTGKESKTEYLTRMVYSKQGHPNAEITNYINN
ncbi:MAG: phospholipid carrier-dependent glycosyltransferase, partial [Candidatus Woesearchaeota archaeon]